MSSNLSIRPCGLSFGAVTKINAPKSLLTREQIEDLAIAGSKIGNNQSDTIEISVKPSPDDPDAAYQFDFDSRFVYHGKSNTTSSTTSIFYGKITPYDYARLVMEKLAGSYPS